MKTNKHIKMSPNETLSEDHKYWADVNSRIPVYGLLNYSETKQVGITTDKNEAIKHGKFSTYLKGTYYHDETLPNYL